MKKKGVRNVLENVRLRRERFLKKKYQYYRSTIWKSLKKDKLTDKTKYSSK